MTTLTIGRNIQNALAQESGSVSGSAHTLTVTANAENEANIWFGMFPQRQTWYSGIWKINLDIATPNANVVWNSAYIARINLSTMNGPFYKPYGAIESLRLTLDHAGIYSAEVESSVAETMVSIDDMVYIVLGFSNAAGTDQTFVASFDELIFMPTRPGPPGGGGYEGPQRVVHVWKRADEEELLAVIAAYERYF